MAMLEKIEDMSSLVRTQASPHWTSACDSNGDHLPELPGFKDVHEHVQPYAEIKIRLMSITSALSNCKILFTMFLYFSTSDLRYFLKSNFYFIKICIFWFVANWFKICSFDAWHHFRSSKVGHQVESHCHVALECFFCHCQLVSSLYLHQPESHQ